MTKCPNDGTPTQLVEQEDDLIGQVVDDRFTIKAVLGVGGMGAVYRAHQHSMDRDIALKLIRRDMSADHAAVRRFLREAKVTSKLSNPHTVTVFDFGQTSEGMVYIAMELLGCASGPDCDDDDPTIHAPNECGDCKPSIIEVCDGNDNDCDGDVDEG